MAKHHDNNTKQIILDSIRESGLPITEACQAHHISRATYYRWLKRAAGKEEAVQFDDIATVPAQVKVAKVTRFKPEVQVTTKVEELICSLKQQYPYYGLVKISFSPATLCRGTYHPHQSAQGVRKASPPLKRLLRPQAT